MANPSEPEVTWPAGVTDADADALDALAAAGVGEGDFDGDLHGVPYEAIEAYEAMEWANAVASAEGQPVPHPDLET
jgi:hypothetical protein